MKLKRVNLIFLFIFIISSNSFSQITINKPAQGCASVTLKQIIGADTVDFSAQQLNNGIKLTCDTTERTLIPIGFAPGNPYYETGYYTQERIPFIPPAAFDAGQKLVLPNDDCWSQYFSFDNFYPSGGTNDAPPFTFYFYDKAYNILLANSNGGICFFDENLPLVKHAFANGIDLVNPPTYDNYICCPYDLSKPFPDADRKWDCTAGGCDDYKISPVMNSINGPFQDINYGAAMGDAGMYINFIGEYPCRICIISFYDIPMFGNSSQHNTSMIVLYETTNVIEFYIKEKPEYTTTNGSNAILGINNIDGTQAFTITNYEYDPDNTGNPTVKSYNNTKWKAYNEAWRIKPTGELSHPISMYKKNTAGDSKDIMQGPLQTDNDGKIIAKPTYEEGPTWYYSKMTVTRLEDNKTFDLWDSILIIPDDIPLLTISHNSASNSVTIAGNSDSTARIDTICAGDDVIFNFKGGTTYEFIEPDYLLNTEIINGTVTVQQPSDVEFVKYKFRVENYLNNDPNSELICTQIDSCIIYNRTIELSLGNDTNICKGSAVTYNDTPDKSGDNYSYSYIWRYISDNQSTEIGNESSVTYQPDASGRLVLNISDNMGCSAENGLTVNIHNAPDITIEGKRDICYGSSTTLKAVASIENCSFSWNDDNISQTDEITVSPEANQIYTVTATNPNAGCTATKDATVTVTKYPVISCSESQRICEGEAAVIEVTGAAQRFMWSSSDISIDGATGTRYEVYPQTTTKYVIHAYNNDTLNCETKDSLTIYVSKNPVIALRYTPNMIDEISPQIQFTDSTEDVTQRLWVISDGSEYTEKSFIHTFVLDDTSSSFSVQLTGRTDAGCTDSAKVDIGIRHDHHLWAPTGLYLHGMNNTTRMFRLYINDLNTYSIKIFDRWGTVVFESNDPEQAWDCTYNGNDVLQGVYSWIAVYSHNDNPKREIRKTGSIMIYN